MVTGLGIDMIAIGRLQAALERRPERAPARLFTPAELAECERRASPIQCLAGRFAAKEAFFKALGTGLAAGVSWQDVELSGGVGQRPTLQASGAAAERLLALEVSRVHVSITHDGGMAAAVVVLESDGQPAP